MQLTLNLFPKPKKVEFFDCTWYFESKSFEYTEGGYTVYMRRELIEATGEIETVAILSGMNFCRQRGNTTFRFMTHEAKFALSNDVILPELADMYMGEIITFVGHILENVHKGLYEWSYEHRCYIFTRVAKTAEERWEEKMKAIYSDLKAGKKTRKEAKQAIEDLEDKFPSMSGWVFYADKYEEAMGKEKYKEIVMKRASSDIDKFSLDSRKN